jgi:Type VI secretion system (T6SS), amidase effector protein 4
MPFGTLWNAYAVDEKGNSIRVGGNCAEYEHQCAIKMSRALKKYDTTNPSVIFDESQFTYKGKPEPVCVADDITHARGAQSLADYLYDYARKRGAKLKPRTLFRPKDHTSRALAELRKKAKTALKGKKGVIFFKDFWGDNNAGDHIDLWNGSTTRNKEANAYFDHASEIWFYEFNEAADSKAPGTPTTRAVSQAG